MPSTEALRLNWNRNRWVISMWHLAMHNDIELPSKCGTIVVCNLFSLYVKLGIEAI